MNFTLKLNVEDELTIQSFFDSAASYLLLS